MAHLLIWQHAASLQAMRVLMDGTGLPDGPISKQADCYMFVIDAAYRKSPEVLIEFPHLGRC